MNWAGGNFGWGPGKSVPKPHATGERAISLADRGTALSRAGSPGEVGPLVAVGGGEGLGLSRGLFFHPKAIVCLRIVLSSAAHCIYGFSEFSEWSNFFPQTVFLHNWNQIPAVHGDKQNSMTSPAGELSCQTPSQPFVQDQIDVLRLVEVTSCSGSRDGPLGSASGTGRAAGVLGRLQGGTGWEGPGGEVFLLLQLHSFRCRSTVQVMMGTAPSGRNTGSCHSFLGLCCLANSSRVQRALTWRRVAGWDSASVSPCKASRPASSAVEVGRVKNPSSATLQRCAGTK